VSEVEKSEFEEARKLVSQIAELKNRLRDLGVIRSEKKIIDDYAQWFCSKKFSLDLRDVKKGGYDALSKFGERIRIKVTTASDIDFELAFDQIGLDDFDYLFVVFINNETWMISTIYRVSFDTIQKFLEDGRFTWNREFRSLSLQVYPDEDNTIYL
jgi:hypothetical protein